MPESTAGCQSFAAAAGSEISIPFELFSDLTDYAFELRGEWGWKQNERAGNAKEYAELHATASLALELRNKHTTFPNVPRSGAFGQHRGSDSRAEYPSTQILKPMLPTTEKPTQAGPASGLSVIAGSQWVPQALADPASRSVLFVWRDEENFRRYWADRVKTIDAPGVPTHPRLIKVGDVIDWFATGWNRAAVKAVKFTPDASDIPDYHRSGCYTFETDGGFLSIRVDGRKVIDAPMHVFPAEPSKMSHMAAPSNMQNHTQAPSGHVGSGALFAVRFFAKEARSNSGSIVTKEDDAHWLIEESEGWVPATSMRCWPGNLPKGLKVFDSEEEANAFMRKWEGHPWYAVPKAWEVVRVLPKYEQVLVGFALANNSV